VSSLAKALALCLTLLLASCALQPQRPQREVTAARPARDAIQHYSLEGRVSVKRGNEARQASILWQHNSERDEIELSGPFGQKAARLVRDASGARLETAARETQTASDWSGLAEQVLGIVLPLDNMTNWVVANVAKGTDGATATRDALGRLQSAKADGWQIDYRTYESESPDALPALIEFRHDDINVRLKIDQWNLGQIN
jgi:outer membrane lipoprotein LolB